MTNYNRIVWAQHPDDRADAMSIVLHYKELAGWDDYTLVNVLVSFIELSDETPPSTRVTYPNLRGYLADRLDTEREAGADADATE